MFAFALPRIADYGDVWDEIRKLSWQWLVVLGLTTLLNLATYGPPLMAALPGLSYFHASRVALVDGALRDRSGRRRGWHGDDGRDAARAASVAAPSGSPSWS